MRQLLRSTVSFASGPSKPLVSSAGHFHGNEENFLEYSLPKELRLWQYTCSRICAGL